MEKSAKQNMMTSSVLLNSYMKLSLLIQLHAQQLIAPQREHRLPMRRFEQECEFLSTMRRPNIIQYEKKASPKRL